MPVKGPATTPQWGQDVFEQFIGEFAPVFGDCDIHYPMVHEPHNMD